MRLLMAETDHREGKDCECQSCQNARAAQRMAQSALGLVDHNAKALELVLEALFAPVKNNEADVDWKQDLKTSLRKVRNV